MLRRPLAVHALTSTAFDGALKTKDMTATVTAADLAAAEVELTSDEQDLVQVLVAAAAAQQTTVRICGGWVRDKALGRVTKDVDVALDNCSGATFAERVVEALAKGLEGGDGRGAALAASSTVGLIAANPEQSKHLETATMRICGVEVDFVNLRSESYADAGDSRIPTMAFGTPQEDAARRDFTLNALFFNVHTRRIEDFTGRGWEDLRAGLLRTPLEPRVTLLDALRPRGVRFASRYGFALDPGFAGGAACCPRSARRSSPRSRASAPALGGARSRRRRPAARAVDEPGGSSSRRRHSAVSAPRSWPAPHARPMVVRSARHRLRRRRRRYGRAVAPFRPLLRGARRRRGANSRRAADDARRDASALACALLPLAEPGCEALDGSGGRRRSPRPSARRASSSRAARPPTRDAYVCCVRTGFFF